MREILKRGILEHTCALERGEYSAEELTRAYLNRIKEADGDVGAFLSTDEESALSFARVSDKRRSSGKALGRLDGIPIAVKDNICVRDMPMSCASKILEGYIPLYDATVIERLKAAGAVILGKTNMDEFGMGSSGENSAFKVTKNPYDKRCVAGGSSGGSAAAVAAGFAPCALGSDTGGSVRQPSAFCGVVGMKPTYGRVSRYGLVAFASSFDQIGVISKNVEDNALLLGAIAGNDKRDMTSSEVVYDAGVGMRDGVCGLRIGVPSELFCADISDEVRGAVLSAIEIYKSLGATVVEISVPSLRYALSAYYVMSSAEASSNLARFDGVRYGRRADKYSDIDELYEISRTEGFGDEVKRRIMLGTFVLSAGYYEKYYANAQRACALLRRELECAFEECDLLLSPTAPEVAFGIGEKNSSPSRMYAQDICTVPANIAGIPAISLPCGTGVSGMPVGVQLMSRAFSENTLYRAAYALQMALGGAR